MSINKLTLGVALALLIGNAGSFIAAQKPAPPQGTGKASTPAKPGEAPPPQPKPWWSDDATKKELGLSAAQAKALDQIFASTKDEIASYYEALQRENKELGRMISESKAERWVVGRQIDKVETQRSNWNKLRLMTLYRMHQELTPEQRVKLQAIRDRDRKDPRKHP